MKEINYIQCGDHLIPDLKLPTREVKPIGKYGRMRMKYLKENIPYLWNKYILDGTLNRRLSEVNYQAEDRMETLIEQMKKQSGITEQLKATDPMKWVGLMNSIKAQAEEIVLKEIIFN